MNHWNFPADLLKWHRNWQERIERELRSWTPEFWKTVEVADGRAESVNRIVEAILARLKTEEDRYFDVVLPSVQIVFIDSLYRRRHLLPVKDVMGVVDELFKAQKRALKEIHKKRTVVVKGLEALQMKRRGEPTWWERLKARLGFRGAGEARVQVVRRREDMDWKGAVSGG